MGWIREFRRQYAELGIMERQSIRTVAFGVGFVLGGAIGWLFGDAVAGAATGTVAGFIGIIALTWGARFSRG